MVLVTITHKVNNFPIWRVHFDADEHRRKKAGIRNERVFVDEKDPNNVTVIWEMDDPIVLDLMFNDPDLVNTMKDAGVISKPEIHVLVEK